MARGSFRDRFNAVSRRLTDAVGAPGAVILALGAVLAWAISGPVFGFSNTWQLVMNTVSSIITFCMVFVIQGSQNRDSRALQLKLDEIIRANADARNELIKLELAPEARIDQAAAELTRAAQAGAKPSEAAAPGSGSS